MGHVVDRSFAFVPPGHRAGLNFPIKTVVSAGLFFSPPCGTSLNMSSILIYQVWIIPVVIPASVPLPWWDYVGWNFLSSYTEPGVPPDATKTVIKKEKNILYAAHNISKNNPPSKI